MISHLNITGLVLAGGKSSRFGSNKALREYEHQSFIQRALHLLKPHTKEQFISGYNVAYEELHINMFPDIVAGIGPLGGVYTALQMIETPWMLVLPCDMPFISEQLISYMIAQIEEEDKLVAWKDKEHIMVFPLLLSKDIYSDIQQNITNKQYSLKALFQKDYAKTLFITKDMENDFTNINYLKEYLEI